MGRKFVYYNENDKKTAAWLRELVKAGLIAKGVVDGRGIQEVVPADLRGFTQCHFFAGIGGWSYALRLAGWPDDRPIWTGSCPCQPFSSAGKRKGTQDERHIWPEFRRLIRECKPTIAFGEQVASADGREWLSGVRIDLEALGYEVGAADLCAASVRSPHKRQRLYWAANNNNNARFQGYRRFELEPISERWQGTEGHDFSDSPLADANRNRTIRYPREEIGAGITQWAEPFCRSVLCTDGKNRRIPIEPSFFPMADGIPARVVRLRGYGNAIVPQVAAEFIKAYLEC